MQSNVSLKCFVHFANPPRATRHRRFLLSFSLFYLD